MCMAGDALVATVPPPALVPSALDNSRKKNLALLQAAMKYAPNLWMFQRYQAVALVLKGYPYAAVSEIIGNRISLRPGRPPRGTGGIKTRISHPNQMFLVVKSGSAMTSVRAIHYPYL